MVSERKDIKHDFRTAFIFTIIVIVIEVLGIFALTTGRGIEDEAFRTKFILYSIIGGVGILFVFVVALTNFITGKRNLKLIVHEPEEALVQSKVLGNPLLLFLGTLMVFSVPLFFLAKFSNTFFSGIPFGAQQITTFSSIWGDSTFPALNENLMFFVPLALVFTWNWKKNRHGATFWLLNLVVIPLVFASLWMLFHGQVYGSNDVALVSTFVFGFVGVMFSLFTMSFIPWAVIHFLTNFMLALKRYGELSSDQVLLWVIVFEVVVVLLFALVYKLDKKKYG